MTEHDAPVQGLTSSNSSSATSTVVLIQTCRNPNCIVVCRLGSVCKNPCWPLFLCGPGMDVLARNCFFVVFELLSLSAVSVLCFVLLC